MTPLYWSVSSHGDLTPIAKVPVTCSACAILSLIVAHGEAVPRRAITLPQPVAPDRPRRPVLYLLVLPYLGLLFPSLYARATPALFGIPFFYWYQFAWVILASLIMGFVYSRTKDPVETTSSNPR